VERRKHQETVSNAFQKSYIGSPTTTNVGPANRLNGSRSSQSGVVSKAALESYVKIVSKNKNCQTPINVLKQRMTDGSRSSITPDKILPDFCTPKKYLAAIPRSFSVDLTGTEDDEMENCPDSILQRSASLHPFSLGFSSSSQSFDEHFHLLDAPPEDSDLNARMEFLFEEYRKAEQELNKQTDNNCGEVSKLNSGSISSRGHESHDSPASRMLLMSASNRARSACQDRVRMNRPGPQIGGDSRHRLNESRLKVANANRPRSGSLTPAAVMTLPNRPLTPRGGGSSIKSTQVTPRPSTAGSAGRTVSKGLTVTANQQNRYANSRIQKPINNCAPGNASTDKLRNDSAQSEITSNSATALRRLSRSSENFLSGTTALHYKSTGDICKTRTTPIKPTPTTSRRAETPRADSSKQSTKLGSGYALGGVERVVAQLPGRRCSSPQVCPPSPERCRSTEPAVMANPRKDDRCRSGSRTRIPMPVDARFWGSNDRLVSSSGGRELFFTLRRFDSGVDIANLSPSAENCSLHGEEDISMMCSGAWETKSDSTAAVKQQLPRESAVNSVGSKGGIPLACAFQTAAIIPPATSDDSFETY